MEQLSHDESIKRVWKVCRILGYVTLFEIAAALTYYYKFQESGFPRGPLNILFIVLSAAKAYFIMSEFMHLKYEVKSMTITILAPFSFLIWGIIAFLWEGHYWLSAKELWNVLY